MEELDVLELMPRTVLPLYLCLLVPLSIIKVGEFGAV